MFLVLNNYKFYNEHKTLLNSNKWRFTLNSYISILLLYVCFNTNNIAALVHYNILVTYLPPLFYARCGIIRSRTTSTVYSR